MLDSRTRRRGVLGAAAFAVPAAALVALTASAVPAMARTVPDPVPIGHRQYFEGMVNGHTAHAVINVVCGGPATTGRPGRGQSVEVTLVVPPVTRYQGYTGSRGHRIQAWLTWTTSHSGTVVSLGTFSSYNAAMKIPRSIKVPCSGTGQMLFVPTPGSKSVHRALVRVAFTSKGV